MQLTIRIPYTHAPRLRQLADQDLRTVQRQAEWPLLRAIEQIMREWESAQEPSALEVAHA